MLTKKELFQAVLSKKATFIEESYGNSEMSVHLYEYENIGFSITVMGHGRSMWSFDDDITAEDVVIDPDCIPYKVLAITRHEDAGQGHPTAIIDLMEGETADEAYFRWLRAQGSSYYEGKDDEFILSNTVDAWFIVEVEKAPKKVEA